LGGGGVGGGGGGGGGGGDFYGITDSRGRSWPKFYCCAAHQVSSSCGTDRLCRVVAAQRCKELSLMYIIVERTN